MMGKFDEKKYMAIILLSFTMLIFYACAVPTESDSEVAKYTAIIEKDPGNVEAYLNRGRVYFTKNQYDKAVADYNKAIGQDPARIEVLYDRACAYIELEKWDNALNDLNTYLADPANEKSFKAFERRGYTYLRKGEYDTAIKECNEAIQLNPGYFPAIATKGKAQKAKANQ
jgi:tetratricopeptide (TPR) repeat protein